MYLESELSWNVVIPPEKFYPDGLMLQNAIITELLASFAAKKATKDLGYFLTVTTISKIGHGKVREHSGDILYPVDFSCITFKIFLGEILEGVVHKVTKHGVYIRCGPAENVFLSRHKMSDYRYVDGENPHFVNDAESSKIEKDAALRFSVISAQYDEWERDFQVLASLEGDYLGPVSM